MNSSHRYRKALNSFRGESETNYIFACQAAVPVLLTPDLLYQLWNNFKQYQYIFDQNTFHKIPHWAVSDLLLADFCKEVGFQLYELKKEVRDLLLEGLVANLGVPRKNTLAAFLKDYAQDQYRSKQKRNLLNIHLLTAASILDRADMERQIISLINQAGSDAEKINLLLLHKHLSPIGFRTELGDISNAIKPDRGDAGLLSPVLITESDPDAPDVLHLNLPASLRARIRTVKKTAPDSPPFRQAADEGETSAEKARADGIAVERKTLLVCILDELDSVDIRASGFLIKGNMLNWTLGDEFFLLTTLHTFQKDDGEWIKEPEKTFVRVNTGVGAALMLSIAEVVWSSHYLDVLLLRFESQDLLREYNSSILPYPMMYAWSRESEFPTTARVIGYSHEGVSSSRGASLFKVEYGGPFLSYQLSPENPPLCSGSPIFDENWRLLGIHLDKPIVVDEQGSKSSGTWAVSLFTEISQLIFGTYSEIHYKPLLILLCSPPDLTVERNIIMQCIREIDEKWRQEKNVSLETLSVEVPFAALIDDEVARFEEAISTYDICFVLGLDLFTRDDLEIMDQMIAAFKKRSNNLRYAIVQEPHTRGARQIDGSVDMSKIPRELFIPVHFQDKRHLKIEMDKLILSFETNPYTRSKFISKDIVALARQYEAASESMPTGPDQTKLFFDIFGQMQNIGDQVLPALPTLTQSDSPGERLVAIAYLRNNIDPLYLNWLADRIGNGEEPFIVEQAILSLDAAVEKTSDVSIGAVHTALYRAIAYLLVSQNEDRNYLEAMENIRQKFLENSGSRLAVMTLPDKSLHQFEGAWFGYYVQDGKKTEFSMELWLQNMNEIAGVIRDYGPLGVADFQGELIVQASVIIFTKIYRNRTYRIEYSGTWSQNPIIALGTWSIGSTSSGNFEMVKKNSYDYPYRL